MDNSGPSQWLAPTPSIDSAHPTIAATARRVAGCAHNDRERAQKLHDFVRDEIRFGWAAAFDRQSASEVLASGIGFCNTKSKLLIALLRAMGIPARVHCVTINRRILLGLIRPPAEFVDHSYTEVLLENRWLGIDSYIVDAPLHRAAVARCHAEKLEIGYGVHPNGSINWDGRTDCFAQFANDGTVPDLSDAVFGSFVDLEQFRATGLARNPSHLPSRLLIRWLTQSANRRVHELRSTAGG